METIPALVTVLGIVVVAVALGLLLRVTSSRRRSIKVSDLQPGDVGLDAFSDVATIVQFSTEYCAKCPAVRRALSALTDGDDALAYTDVDLTNRPELAAKFRVLQTPTVLVVDSQGAVVSRFAGAIDTTAVRSDIDRLKRATNVSGTRSQN